VQAVLKQTKRSIYRQQQVYPLSGHLVSPCGQRFSGAYDAVLERRYYRCKGKEEPPYCSCSRIEAQAIEEKVWWQIVPCLEDPKWLLEVTGLDKDVTKDRVRAQGKTLDTKIKNLTSAITHRAADALAKGLDPALIAAAVEQLEDQRDALLTQREKLREWENVQRDRKERREKINVLARAAFKLLNGKHDLTFEKTLFALLNVRVHVEPDGLRIAGTFREDLPELLHVVDGTVSGRRASRRT
jgi:hypothetical protein